MSEIDSNMNSGGQGSSNHYPPLGQPVGGFNYSDSMPIGSAYHVFSASAVAPQPGGVGVNYGNNGSSGQMASAAVGYSTVDVNRLTDSMSRSPEMLNAVAAAVINVANVRASSVQRDVNVSVSLN